VHFRGKLTHPLWVGDKGATAIYRLRLVDELAGPSGNMGFGWVNNETNSQTTKQRRYHSII